MNERPTRSAVHDDSGTVLADPDPLVPLTAEQEERLRRAFEGAAAAPEESAEPLLTAADLLGVLNATGGGFRLSQEVLAAWLGRDEHLPAFRKKSFALDEVRAIAAKINADSSGYGSRMRLCAGRSHLRKLREYYERGCGLNTADATGRTALHVAAELEELDSIQALYDLGGGKELIIDARDKYGWTPLMSAAAYGKAASVRLLLHLEADVSAANNEGRTALHWAAAKGRVAVVRLLLAQPGVEKEAADRARWTALHCAAFSAQRPVIKMLLGSGANADARDMLGRRPAAYCDERVWARCA